MAEGTSKTTMGKEEQNPLLVLLFYSLLMITLPLTGFFVSQAFLERVFDISESQTYIYSTAISVIIVHVILGMFVYKAYHEDSPKLAPMVLKKD